MRTKSEARERGRNGGKASGKARRRKADFRRTLNQLLTAEIENEDYRPILEALGVECTLESALLMAQIKEAMKGNTKAAYFVAQYAGQSEKTPADDEEQRIRTDRAKRARDQEVGDESGAEGDDGFLAALQNTAADDWKDFEGERSEETSSI